MVEDLSCKKSKITILGRPLICKFCMHNVFIPYSTYVNVEDPGIKVYYLNYSAVCMQCGCVTQFGDPSGPSIDGTDYIWALEQAVLLSSEE